MLFRSNDTISNLYAGVYSVIAIDANNCASQKIIAVNNISSATISVDSSISVRCNGDINGSIYLSLTNGEAPFTYEWSNGVTTLNLLNQPAGQYVLTVTDNNGCLSILIDTIYQPAPLQVVSFVSNPKCNLKIGRAHV